jgi:hypothetical protein
MDYSRWKMVHDNAPLIAQNITLQDTCPAIIFQFCGELGADASAATAATCQFAQGASLTFTVGATTPAGIDAIGTSGVFNTSTGDYDSVGEVVNAVNDVGLMWRAIGLVAPETPMANLLTKGSASCITDNGYVVYLDSSVADTEYLHAIPITGEAFLSNGPDGHVKDATVEDGGNGVINIFNYAKMSTDITTAGTLNIKMWKQGDTVSTTVLQEAMADDSLVNTGNYNHPELDFIKSREGYMFSVEWRSDASFNTDPDICRVVGRSVVTDDSRIVTKVPYLVT